MSLETDDGRNIELIDKHVDPSEKIDRDVYLEYLDAANKLAGALCTDKVIYHPKREKVEHRNAVIFALDNVTIRWSRGFGYTTSEGNQVHMRFVKQEHHDRDYPFAESVAMEITRYADSEIFHEIATMHGNGISMKSTILNNPDILGDTERHIGDIEEFVLAMRMALSDQLNTQAVAAPIM